MHHRRQHTTWDMNVSVGIGFCAPALVLVIAAIMIGCDQFGATAYTLYRNSVLDDGARYHVASFDARESERYNRDNCEVARQLFQSQPGVRVRYWCEKGRYRE